MMTTSDIHIQYFNSFCSVSLSYALKKYQNYDFWNDVVLVEKMINLMENVNKCNSILKYLMNYFIYL